MSNIARAVGDERSGRMAQSGEDLIYRFASLRIELQVAGRELAEVLRKWAGWIEKTLDWTTVLKSVTEFEHRYNAIVAEIRLVVGLYVLWMLAQDRRCSTHHQILCETEARVECPPNFHFAGCEYVFDSDGSPYWAPSLPGPPQSARGSHSQNGEGPSVDGTSSGDGDTEQAENEGDRSEPSDEEDEGAVIEITDAEGNVVETIRESEEARAVLEGDTGHEEEGVVIEITDEEGRLAETILDDGTRILQFGGGASMEISPDPDTPKTPATQTGAKGPPGRPTVDPIPEVPTFPKPTKSPPGGDAPTNPRPRPTRPAPGQPVGTRPTGTLGEVTNTTTAVDAISFLVCPEHQALALNVLRSVYLKAGKLPPEPATDAKGRLQIQVGLPLVNGFVTDFLNAEGKFAQPGRECAPIKTGTRQGTENGAETTSEGGTTASPHPVMARITYAVLGALPPDGLDTKLGCWAALQRANSPEKTYEERLKALVKIRDRLRLTHKDSKLIPLDPSAEEIKLATSSRSEESWIKYLYVRLLYACLRMSSISEALPPVLKGPLRSDPVTSARWLSAKDCMSAIQRASRMEDGIEKTRFLLPYVLRGPGLNAEIKSQLGGLSTETSRWHYEDDSVREQARLSQAMFKAVRAYCVGAKIREDEAARRADQKAGRKRDHRDCERWLADLQSLVRRIREHEKLVRALLILRMILDPQPPQYEHARDTARLDPKRTPGFRGNIHLHRLDMMDKQWKETRAFLKSVVANSFDPRRPLKLASIALGFATRILNDAVSLRTGYKVEDIYSLVNAYKSVGEFTAESLKVVRGGYAVSILRGLNSEIMAVNAALSSPHMFAATDKGVEARKAAIRLLRRQLGSDVLAAKAIAKAFWDNCPNHPKRSQLPRIPVPQNEVIPYKEIRKVLGIGR